MCEVGYLVLMFVSELICVQVSMHFGSQQVVKSISKSIQYRNIEIPRISTRTYLRVLQRYWLQCSRSPRAKTQTSRGTQCVIYSASFYFNCSLQNSTAQCSRLLSDLLLRKRKHRSLRSAEEVEERAYFEWLIHQIRSWKMSRLTRVHTGSILIPFSVYIMSWT